MAGKKTPKGLIIDALPKNLKKPLDNEKLKDLSFKDLDTITRQLEKFAEENPTGYQNDACGLTIKWGG